MSVTITKPASGATLTGLVVVEATFSGKNFEIATVSVDGQQVGSDSAKPIAFSIDTTKVVDGPHTLTVAVRYRTAGGAQRWQKASIPITTEGNDMKVDLSTSGGTANLAGTVTVTATVTPTVQAETPVSCKFSIDNGPVLSTDTSYPLTFSWNTTLVGDGDHILRAVVTAGPRTRTATGALTVAVKNAADPPPPPILDPPGNLTAPTITGTAQVGQLLTVNVGTWSNEPTGYSKQWRVCDAAGANCASIPGATGQTYSVVAADQGDTIRCVVIASNSAGASPSVTTAQTGVVAAAPGAVPTADFTFSPASPVVGQTVTFTPTTNGTICYWDRTLDQVPEATLAPGTPFTFAYTSEGTKTMCLQTASAGGIKSPWVCKTLVVSVDVPAPPPASAYFYWTGNTLPGPWRAAEPEIGSGTFSTYIYLVDGGTATRLMQNANGGMIWTWGIKTALTESRFYNHGSIGKETWYRARMRFPSSHFFPAPGDFNLHQQWHSNTGLLGTGSWNSFVGVRTDSNRQNPRLILVIRAGVMSSSSPYTPAVDVTRDPFPAGSLLYDHWYDSLLRIKWYPDSRGSISWYVDGILKYENLAGPTLLQTASGVNDIVDYQIDNYRRNDTTTESWVDFNLVACGPTRASVGA